MRSKLKSIIKTMSKVNPNGFTYDPKKKTSPNHGYVVATKKTQDCIGKKGLHKVIKFYRNNPNFCIGGWKNEDGEMQYDASLIFDNFDDAVEEAINNNQRAIFNLNTGETIMRSEF